MNKNLEENDFSTLRRQIKCQYFFYILLTKNTSVQENNSSVLLRNNITFLYMKLYISTLMLFIWMQKFYPLYLLHNFHCPYKNFLFLFHIYDTIKCATVTKNRKHFLKITDRADLWAPNNYYEPGNKSSWCQ